MLVNSRNLAWGGVACALLAVSAFVAMVYGKPLSQEFAQGKALYNYYCYQCHGYAGDARTLAATYLEPKPRDFTSDTAKILNRQAMLDAVTTGRTGTAMVSFARVLTDRQIELVVDFIRVEFMSAARADGRYHTAANGWPNHQRYAPAFPFATGELPLDTPWETLSADARSGKRLFLSTCITCHDRAHVQKKGPIWNIRAVSYPRQYYNYSYAGEHEKEHEKEHDDEEEEFHAYELHEQSLVITNLSAGEKRGEAVFLQNCAFCHAPDGSGRNWIGSFLEPNPAKLSESGIASMSSQQLRHVIEQGLSGTSMPAWRQVLEPQQIEDLVVYLQRVFARFDGISPTEPAAAAGHRDREVLLWRRAISP